MCLVTLVLFAKVERTGHFHRYYYPIAALGYLAAYSALFGVTLVIRVLSDMLYPVKEDSGGSDGSCKLILLTPRYFVRCVRAMTEGSMAAPRRRCAASLDPCSRP